VTERQKDRKKKKERMGGGRTKERKRKTAFSTFPGIKFPEKK